MFAPSMATNNTALREITSYTLSYTSILNPYKILINM